MQYRLPDRFAGRRCRCRECGAAIRVPDVEASEEELTPRRTRARRARAAATDSQAGTGVKNARPRKARRARETTRRLGSNEREILSETAALRRSCPPRRPGSQPISESLHQLTPLALSGGVERPATFGPPTAVAVKTKQRRRRLSPPEGRRGREKEEAREDPSADTRPRKGQARKRRREREREAPAAQAPAKGRGLEKTRKRGGKAREATHPEGGKSPANAGAPRGTRAGPKQAGIPRAPKRSPYTNRMDRRRRRTPSSGDQEAVGSSGTHQAGKRKISPVALAVAGGLCLLIGTSLGLAFFGLGSGGNAQLLAEYQKTMKDVEGYKKHLRWQEAQQELQALETKLREAEMQEELRLVGDTLLAVNTMVELMSIESDEALLATLVSNADKSDPSIRLGITMQLRQFSEQPEAQDALAVLARDTDDRVATAARQALIAAGGVASIPYLAQAIEESAAHGGRLGEIALERALEIYEPEVAPVLLKALEVRNGAPAAVLTAILERLHELGDERGVPAARKFLDHQDKTVRAAAQAIVDDLG